MIRRFYNDGRLRIKRKKPAFSQEQLAKCSEYFDLQFYREASGQPQLNATSGLLHYLQKGWREGLDPSAEFSTKGYLGLYPDVADAGMNPLFHFVVHGMFENRRVEMAGEGYEGRIEKLTEKGLTGWIVDKAGRGHVLPLRVLLNGEFYGLFQNDVPRPDLLRKGLAAGLGGFSISLPLYLMEPGQLLVEIELPDGSRLSDKITIKMPADVALRRRSPVFAEQGHDRVKVVVPIYNAIDDVRVCIERLRDHTPAGVEVILIDDCSPDPAIGELLATLDGETRFRVLRNEENLGFTRTINRGLNEAGTADVIILNSDARVTPRWVEGMFEAANSRDNVATVTAMSDRAGAFSAPNIGNENPLPAGIDEIKYGRAFRRRSLRLYPEVPTGNGFCMYIARSAINALGPLDAEAFPRGYGEENDFCMRAMRAGWVNLIDDATYVFHDRSKSFGEAKNDHMIAGRKVVDERYPEYKLLTGIYRTNGAICMARYRARLALADCISGRDILPRALFVIATRTGGTPQTNADLMGALDDTFECYVLRCDSSNLELTHYRDGISTVLQKHQLSEPIEPLQHRSSEYDSVVSQWLAMLELDVIHIRHLGWHSLSLPQIAKQSGARVIYSFHDFYTLCPSLKLLDENNVFCGGTCTATEGTCKVELWSSNVPPLKDAWVHFWRERMAKALSYCDGFVTTSPSARDRIQKFLPSLPTEHFHVIPHGRDFRQFETLQHLPNGDGPVRILIPGNIDKAKGLDLILALIDLDKLGNFEFHVLGKTNLQSVSDDLASRLHLHGTYDRGDFADKVRAIAPHFGAVLSVWDETYCHTLTEMWSVGLPVAVLDFPTLRRRIDDCGAGWVLDDIQPEAVYQQLCEIAADRDGLIEKGSQVIRWQMRRGTAQSCRQMASRYLDVYRGEKVGQESPKIGVVSPSDTSLRRAPASTEIRVWERTRNRLDRPVDYVRSSPAGLIAKMRLGTVSGAIVQRTALPAAMIKPFLETARETGTHYIFEIDDQLMGVPEDKDPKGFYKAYAPHLEQLVRGAKALIVTTPALQKELAPLNPNINLVENRISARLWSGAGLQRSKNFEPTLLYAGGTTHDEDLDFALDAIALARTDIPNLRLTVVGITGRTDLPDWVDVIKVGGREKTYSHFVPWLRSQVGNTVLGIAPLIDNEFNRYESDLKILDYGALGLPVIASNVESFRSFEDEDLNGAISLLPNRKLAWSREIVRRLNDPAKLREDGERLQRWVFDHRRIEDSLDHYDSIIVRHL